MRHLSFTGVVAELNLTQPAMTQNVLGLESFLDHDLFLPKVRMIEPTDACGGYLDAPVSISDDYKNEPLIALVQMVGLSCEKKATLPNG